MLKKLFYFTMPLVIVLLLALITLASETNATSVYKIESLTQSSMIEINESVNSNGVIVKVNQAANFNHAKQLSVDYVVTLLAIFFVIVVNFRRYKPTTLPPPWYLTLKHSSRISLSGWKVSNLLYKSKLLYQY